MKSWFLFLCFFVFFQTQKKVKLLFLKRCRLPFPVENEETVFVSGRNPKWWSRPPTQATVQKQRKLKSTRMRPPWWKRYNTYSDSCFISKSHLIFSQWSCLMFLSFRKITFLCQKQCFFLFMTIMKASVWFVCYMWMFLFEVKQMYCNNSKRKVE